MPIATAFRLRSAASPCSLQANPKRYDFKYDFLGHDRAVIDEQMMSDIDPGGAKVPPAPMYRHFAEPVHVVARMKNTSPREVQDIAWQGIKANKEEAKKRTFVPKPMIQEVNEAIERTHRLTGMPRQEILKRGIIRSEIPVYGVIGAARAGRHDRRGGSKTPRPTGATARPAPSIPRRTSRTPSVRRRATRSRSRSNTARCRR
jgi:hypothetical protein